MKEITRESLYEDLDIKLSELRREYKVGKFMERNAEPTDGMSSICRYIDWRKRKHVEDKLLIKLASAQHSDLQSCGHPKDAIAGKGRTHWCAACESAKAVTYDSKRRIA